MILCFNPYFAGSSSGSCYRKQKQNSLLEVSILILLEVVLEALMTARKRAKAEGFNPYFAGSSSGSIFRILLLSYKVFRFNPYFAGSSSGSIAWEFYVNGLGTCFNPYFAGSSSGSRAHDHENKAILEFQSLFCWK